MTDVVQTIIGFVSETVESFTESKQFVLIDATAVTLGIVPDLIKITSMAMANQTGSSDAHKVRRARKLAQEAEAVLNIELEIQATSDHAATVIVSNLSYSLESDTLLDELAQSEEFKNITALLVIEPPVQVAIIPSPPPPVPLSLFLESKSDSDGNDDATSLIIGGTLGGFVALLGAIGVAYYFLKKNSKKEVKQLQPQHSRTSTVETDLSLVECD